jgi:hypothetical protein
MTTKYTKRIPNGHKNTPNGHKIYQYLPFEGPPKFTQILDVWFENKPSDNPALESSDGRKNVRNFGAFLEGSKSYVGRYINRVARFLVVILTKTRKNIPDDHKIYQMAIK